MNLKNEFLEIARTNIKRDGIEDLLTWVINETDLFIAPASTKYHGACEFGLVTHSINVQKCLLRLCEKMDIIGKESIAIVSLFHDLCKVNFYKIEMRNAKIDGKWEQVPYYTVEDQFPMGHGEKSLYLVNKFLKLSDDEALAIRWHMGGFDESVKGGSYAGGNAYNKSKLAVMLHMADMMATYLLENESKV